MDVAETKGQLGEVFVVKTPDRDFGIRSLLSQFHLGEYAGKKVALKANYNSADPFPASTHIDTLRAIVQGLKGAGIGDLTLAERSGMGNTSRVLEHTGVTSLAAKLGFRVVVLDEAKRDEWVEVRRHGTHWLRGFYLSRIFVDSERIVQTCCLKTHRFGGKFSMSLKNSVGIIAKKVPGGLYDYMWELHASPNQRLMIAEINRFYNVDLVIMDALKAFINKGPERGDVVEPQLLLASNDRIAIDAVGLAILRRYGAKSVMEGRVFELDQIRRAFELGIGIKSVSGLRLTPLNSECRDDVDGIMDMLGTQG